jgi:quinol monooxygenase YgiN
MLCALTVRKLKADAFEEFAEAFRPEGGAPKGWVRFDMLRDTADPDRVVTFGFFDGSMEELQANQEDHGYAERRDRASKHVEAVEVNGVFEVAYERVA